MPNSRERQERYQRLQQRRNIWMSSQPTSREVSPTPRRTPGGSDPDVREAVQMMVTEVTMFDQIMEKINSLVAEVREYKEQNDARLQRHEEALEHRMQEGTLDQEQPADSNLHQPQERELDQEDPVQQLRRQLEERNRELEETRLQLLRMNAAPVLVVHTREQEIQEFPPANDYRGQQRDQKLAEVRRLAPSVQHTMTRCQDHHGPQVSRSSPPQPLPWSRPHTPIPEQQLYPERRHTYDPQTYLPQQFQPRSSPQCPQSAHPSSQLSGTPFSYVFKKETVPHFKGDTSASQPLKKNQAIESWIRTIENIVKPATSEMFIQAARANCRGPAELIINSPLFDSITEWDTFKAALRSKFRGTYTSDFYKVLYDIRMTPSQAPMDFFLQLEGHVYQGYRDHCKAIGDPSELVKRVFLSGIPAWLQDFLSVKEDGIPTQIAETAQRIWNSHNGIRHSDTSPAEENPYHPNRPPRGRDLYAMPVAAERSSASYHRSPVRERWCEHHRVRTHGTSECRARAEILDPRSPRRRCYHCRGPGHLLSVVRVTTPEVPENAEVSRFSLSHLSPPDISSAVHLPPHSGRFLEGVVARLCAMLDQGLLLLRCARDLGPVRPGYVPCWIKDCCYFDALGTLVQYAQAMCHAGSRGCCYFDVLGTLVQYAQAMCHAGSRVAVTSMR
ncbi:hypothetical protein C7M84_007002 [Penaeus vannamei]|uniref:Retrotransposon gag domain-containing protein n=1 Tax=Penaeus vannamei TaxID=6689 RepID=A0A423TDC6_PENVA|nr:hypothetical protein C7M84_007002 [Penaeus vannamei]